MFDTIPCYVSGNRIEVNGQTFLLGELTADMLNITRDEYSEMNGLSERIMELLGQRDSGDTLFALRVEISALRSLLIKQKLFHTLAIYPSQSEYNASDDLFYIPEELREEARSDAEETLEQMTSGHLDEQLIRRQAKKYCSIVNDIYAFNQTIFWFICEFLSRLLKMDAENYAAALFDFFSNPRRDKMIVNPIHDNGHIFTVLDFIQVHYAPREIPGLPNNYAIYECYQIECLQSFLKLDFYRALMAGHVIRQCKNCKKYFLLTQGYHTEYCDRPLKENPKRNCRNQGAKNIAKEKAANNPVIKSYERAYQRVNADFSRKRITENERDRARQRLADLRDEAVSGKYRDREVDDLMRSENLYAALNITRRGGR